jgi:hypothetical protein
MAVPRAVFPAGYSIRFLSSPFESRLLLDCGGLVRPEQRDAPSIFGNISTEISEFAFYSLRASGILQPVNKC